MKRVVLEAEPQDRIFGERPIHLHTNPDPKAKIKQWECNSPYCEDVRTSVHPDDGGPEPIVQGREPWRGGGR